MCYFNPKFFLRVYKKLINIHVHAFKKTLILTLLNNSFSTEYMFGVNAKFHGNVSTMLQ